MRESRFAKALELNLTDLEASSAIDCVLQDKRTPDEELTQVTLENVCGFWRGSDPDLADEVIVISAHYDHVGIRNGEIHNGADDNGSGTTGLLALSEALTTYGKLRRSVLVMWVSGEEKGLWGSKAWTLNPWLPEGCRAVANINIDMVGRNDADKLMVTPTRNHEAYNGLTKLAERLAPLEGFPALGDADDYYQRSDHYNFKKNLDIPVAFLFSDLHEDYHKPTDTPDKIDCDKIRRVARLVLRMLDGMQDDVLDL
jgi:Zn-dependent M28 family amino/carboxypeptidase